MTLLSWQQNAAALWNIRKLSVSLTDIEISWWYWRMVSISESDTPQSTLVNNNIDYCSYFIVTNSKFPMSESDNRPWSLCANILLKRLPNSLNWWWKMVANIKVVAWGKIHAAVRYNLQGSNTMRGIRRSEKLNCVVVGDNIISIKPPEKKTAYTKNAPCTRTMTQAIEASITAILRL